MNDRIQLAINDGIADVRLARPTKLNALDPAMFKAIAEAGAQLTRLRGFALENADFEIFSTAK